MLLRAWGSLKKHRDHWTRSLARGCSIPSEARVLLRAWGSLKKHRDHWTRSLTDLEYSNCNHGIWPGDKATVALCIFLCLWQPNIRPTYKTSQEVYKWNNGPLTDQSDCCICYNYILNTIIPFLFQRDYKCLGEGNILVITPLLPRIQGWVRIYKYIIALFITANCFLKAAKVIIAESYKAFNFHGLLTNHKIRPTKSTLVHACNGMIAHILNYSKKNSIILWVYIARSWSVHIRWLPIA